MTGKNRFLSVRMTEAERKHLDELAEKSGLSLSNTIRSCKEWALDIAVRNGKKQVVC